MSDRIQSAAAAKRLGISRRMVQQMAAQGKVPGSAKIGGVWTFDPDALDAWVKKLEAQVGARARRRVAPNMKSTFRPHGSVDDTAYEQLMSKSRCGSPRRPRRGPASE